MTKTILATLTALILMGSGVAYGETATIQVPFDSHGTSCWYDEETILYHCTWQGEREIFTIEDLEQFKEYLSEEIYQEELARLTEPTVVEVVPELTIEEKLIIKLEKKLDNGTAKAEDSVLYNLLKTLDECHQGLGNSSAVQTIRTFTISNYEYGSQNNVDIKGEMGKLLKAIQECKAQNTLEYKVLSVAYGNMHNGENDITYDHYKEFEGISAIPYPQYTKSDFKVDTGVICNSHAYPDTYKAQMGCEILYDGKTAEQIKAENLERFGNNGVIGYQSETLDNYFEFLENYGNKQATLEDKQIQADIAQPIARELIEDNLFYQNNRD